MKSEVRTPSLRFSSRRKNQSRFYIAELVQECRVRGIKTSFVWVNIHLFKASSAQEAYSKALKKGKNTIKGIAPVRKVAHHAGRFEGYVSCFRSTRKSPMA